MPNFSNIQVHSLQKYLLNKFNSTLYSNILKVASIHKLTKKTSTDKDSFINNIIYIYDKK